MKKVDLAYCAGLFDGEGCISIVHRGERGGRGRGYVLLVQLVNTNPWACQYFKFAFGGYVTFRKGARKNWRDYWAWVAASNQALIFLEVVLPYLKLKRPEAEIAITFQKARAKRGPRRQALTEAEAILTQRQREQLKNYKNTIY